MKIVPLAEVKSHLSAYMEMCQTEPVIITKNGRASAMLVSYSDDDELVSLLIANNPRFRHLIQDAEKRLDETGGIPHDEFWKRVEANYQTAPARPKKVAQRRAAYRTTRTRKK